GRDRGVPRDQVHRDPAVLTTSAIPGGGQSRRSTHCLTPGRLPVPARSRSGTSSNASGARWSTTASRASGTPAASIHGQQLDEALPDDLDDLCEMALEGFEDRQLRSHVLDVFFGLLDAGEEPQPAKEETDSGARD